MIERYQSLLNDCIDLQEDNKRLEIMKKVENFMKGNLEMLGNKGKHTVQDYYRQQDYIKELEMAILLKNKEIRDIKSGCAEEFEKIKKLCFVNDYNGKYDAFSKIQEIAQDNFSMLVKDIAIEDGISTKAKIIELPKTDQSAR